MPLNTLEADKLQYEEKKSAEHIEILTNNLAVNNGAVHSNEGHTTVPINLK